MANINDFAFALAFVLRWEGGYVNDPDDPGGETKWGISKRAYPELDIKNLTEGQMQDIYREDYWLAAGCASHSWPMNLIIFDTAVNMGIRRASQFKAAQDWHEYLLMRIAFYSKLAEKRSMRKYLRGWLNRVVALYRHIDKGG